MFILGVNMDSTYMKDDVLGGALKSAEVTEGEVKLSDLIEKDEKDEIEEVRREIDTMISIRNSLVVSQKIRKDNLRKKIFIGSKTAPKLMSDIYEVKIKISLLDWYIYATRKSLGYNVKEPFPKEHLVEINNLIIVNKSLLKYTIQLSKTLGNN